MVEKFYHCLNENETLVIQIVNYDRILKIILKLTFN